MLSPFSPSALASLPHTQRPARYPSIHNDYLSINPQVRIPNKTPTGPLKVEAKVWFANERTWIAWLNNAVLIATLALALFNASRDRIGTNFAYAYALISLGVLVYGYVLYQHRITRIRMRDPRPFDVVIGPVIISSLLFFAILANFLIRVRELRDNNIPIPGADLYYYLFALQTPIQ